MNAELMRIFHKQPETNVYIEYRFQQIPAIMAQFPKGFQSVSYYHMPGILLSWSSPKGFQTITYQNHHDVAQRDFRLFQNIVCLKCCYRGLVQRDFRLLHTVMCQKSCCHGAVQEDFRLFHAVAQQNYMHVGTNRLEWKAFILAAFPWL